MSAIGGHGAFDSTFAAYQVEGMAGSMGDDGGRLSHGVEVV